MFVDQLKKFLTIEKIGSDSIFEPAIVLRYWKNQCFVAGSPSPAMVPDDDLSL